jgi:hypothetical protein
MGLSGIKPINGLSDSNFYQKIMHKYHTGKKSTSRFPTMFFFKGKNSVSPKKFDILFKFNLHLNQKKILPLLILKNNPDINVQSDNYVTKIFLTALKISKGSSVASEQFLTGNITNNSNNILNSSFLRVSNILSHQKASTIFPDIIIRDPKILNYKNNIKILKSQIFWKNVHSRLLSSTQNLTPTYKENKLMYWPIIKEVILWLNTAKNGLQPIMNQKDTLAINDVVNAYVSQAAFKISQEFQTESDFILTGNTFANKMLKSSFLTVNNALDYQKTTTIYPGIIALNPKIGCVRELLINYKKTSMLSIFKKYIERFLPFRFSTTHTHDLKLLNSEINMEILNSQIFGKNIYSRPLVKNIPVIKEISPRLNTEKNDLQSLLEPKNVQNKSNVAKVYGSSATFKIPSMYQNASRFLPTGRIFTNKNLVFSFKGHVHDLLISSEKVNIIAVFNKYIERFYPFRFSISHTYDPFLKSSIFKARDTVTNSNKILKLLTLSENSIYHHQATSSTYFGAEEVSSQILNHKINEKILKSQVFRLNKNYGLFKNDGPLLSNNNSDFISKNSIIKDHFTSVKNFYENFGQEIPSYIQSKNASEISNENLIFQDQRQIEQEIELIKKTIIETKKSVSEKTVPVFGEAEIKKYFDINRISSQVYQNIERTIRMERERRGM